MNTIAMMDSFDLSCLSDAAAFVDAKLDLLDDRARQSQDPDSDGIFDRGEYLAGIGFVACQAYISESLSLAQIDRHEGLRLGPQHRCGHSMATLVNAIANYWKHSAEWSEPLERRAQITTSLIDVLGVDVNSSYVVVNSLAALVHPHGYRIRHLLPFLSQWRREKWTPLIEHGDKWNSGLDGARIKLRRKEDHDPQIPS